METDDAPVGTATAAHITAKPSACFSSLEDKVEALKLDRRRRESASCSRVLKGILRPRSEQGSGPHPYRASSGQKFKQKRAVTFTLDDKEDEARTWNGKRLRCLALDLDRWDSLPYMALRTLNKQKTRQTKRLKVCHSNDDQKAEQSPGVEVDKEASLKTPRSDQKGIRF